MWRTGFFKEGSLYFRVIYHHLAMTKQNDITYKMGVSFYKNHWKQEKRDQKHYQHIISGIFIKNTFSICIIKAIFSTHSSHSLVLLCPKLKWWQTIIINTFPELTAWKITGLFLVPFTFIKGMCTWNNIKIAE